MTRRISLSVNDNPIEIDYFVQGFIDHTMAGIVSSLEGINEISDIKIEISDSVSRLSVNGDSVPLNDFTDSIISSTVMGMVSSLKGVERSDKIEIIVQR